MRSACPPVGAPPTALVVPFFPLCLVRSPVRRAHLYIYLCVCAADRTPRSILVSDDRPLCTKRVSYLCTYVFGRIRFVAVVRVFRHGRAPPRPFLSSYRRVYLSGLTDSSIYRGISDIGIFKKKQKITEFETGTP